MSPNLLLLVIVPTIVVGVIPGSTNLLDKPGCEEFPQGIVFNKTQALGTWYRLPIPSGDRGGRYLECINLSIPDEKELFDLAAQLIKAESKDSLNWARLTLKVQVPCYEVQRKRTEIYYMEQVGDQNGSYKALYIPGPKPGHPPKKYHLYLMRMKFIGQYLVVTDCDVHYMFHFAKEKLAGEELDKTLKKLMGNK